MAATHMVDRTNADFSGFFIFASAERLIFWDHLLQTQVQCIPTTRKSGKNTRIPPWMNKDLLDKLKHKMETY